MNRILLIEDNEQLQKYISDYLNAYGFEAHILEDYDAVLETIEKTTPRLVLLDYLALKNKFIRGVRL